jgi:hypothetical protein
VLVGAALSAYDVLRLLHRVVSGLEIYTAVLEDGVRTPEQFDAWLNEHG